MSDKRKYSQIPENWKETKLGDVADVFDCPHSTPAWTTDGYFVVRNYNLSNGKIIRDKTSSYTDKKNYEERIKRAIPDVGDIILSREAPIGALGMVQDKEKICLGQRVVLIKPKKVIDRFLMYQMLSPIVQNEFKIAEASGSVVSNFRIPQIKDLLLLLPDIQEQKSIAAVLSAFDDKIDLLGEQNRTLEGIAQAFFKHWFIDFEFPDQNGKPYKSNGGKMIDSEWGEVPERWRIGPLGDVLSLQYGKALKEEERMGKGYPVIGSSGIVGYHDKFLVKDGGIVVGRKGTMGSVIWVEDSFYPIDTTFFIEDKLGVGLLYFHYLLLLKQNFEKIGSDSAVPGLNRDSAYSIDVIIPSADDVTNFNSIVDPIFQKLRLNNSQIRTLSKIRDTILPKLVTGQLQIKDITDNYV